jgi:hypothetical protein
MSTTPEVEQSPAYHAARCQIRRLRKFYIHLTVFLAVNAGLLAANLLFAPNHLRVRWTLVGWGIGVVIHGASVLLGGRLLGVEWEARKVREMMGGNNF